MEEDLEAAEALVVVVPGGGEVKTPILWCNQLYTEFLRKYCARGNQQLYTQGNRGFCSEVLDTGGYLFKGTGTEPGWEELVFRRWISLFNRSHSLWYGLD